MELKEQILELLHKYDQPISDPFYSGIEMDEFGNLAEEIVKLCNLQNVSNHVCPNCGSHETSVCEIFCMDCEEYHNY